MSVDGAGIALDAAEALAMVGGSVGLAGVEGDNHDGSVSVRAGGRAEVRVSSGGGVSLETTDVEQGESAPIAIASGNGVAGSGSVTVGV